MQSLLERFDWDDVRLFLVLARSATMGEAAQRLGVDPSTVSRRLAGLEAALDAQLFVRGRHGLRLTEAGSDLVPTAELIESGVARFTNVVDGFEREVTGVVRFACPPDVAEVFVLPGLSELFQRHSGLTVQVEPANAVADLGRREADIALRIVRPERGDLIVRKVREFYWRLAGSPALIDALGEVSTLDQVPWLAFGDRLSAFGQGAWLERRLSGPPKLRSDDLSTLISAARRGLGVSLFPEPAIAHHGLALLRTGPAVDLGNLPESQLFLVTHAALRQVPRVAAVWEAALEWMAA